MSYEVIARKYRPQRFEEVVGQDHVIQTLRNAIDKNRIAHAYLFCGPRGTGKTTLARIFAKCLNCEDGPRSDFADEDPRCLEIAEGRSLDVMEIDGASNRGIDEIRELRDTARYAPSSARYKVYIIDEVHMLTKEAFNALLKTLEEPPEHVKFMFATTEPEKVLPTILSRCQRFDLRRIPNALIISHLSSIAAAEGVQIDEPSLAAIARGADGGMRDAESTLDQLISFCGEQIEEADALTMFGLTSRESLLTLADSILAGDGGNALRTLEELTRHGKDLGRLLGDLLELFRSMLTLSLCGDGSDFLGLSADETKAFGVRLQSVDPSALARIVEALLDAENAFRLATSKRIAVEMGLMRAIEARSAVSIDDALDRLRALRDGDDPSEAAPGKSDSEPPKAVEATPVSPSRPRLPPREEPSEPTPLPKRAIATEAHVEESARLDANDADTSEVVETPSDSSWEALLESLRATGGFVVSFLYEAHLVGLEDGAYVIGFDPQARAAMEMADNQRVKEAVSAALASLSIDHREVRFVHAERPEGWRPVIAPEPEPEPAVAGVEEEARAAAPPAPEPEPVAPVMMDPDEFREDPLIQAALTDLKARIVDVRPAKT